MTIIFEQRDADPGTGGGHWRSDQALTPDWVLTALACVLLAGQTAAKLYLALNINPLWDEAHFVLAGRHPDWGYPDIPAGPALLAAGATALFGDTVIGLRAICLAAAQLLPLAVFFLTRQFCPRREAMWAAIITLFLPTTGLPGAFYYPEAFLQLALVLMLAFLVRAINDDRWSDWLLTGLAGAAGLFLHYRFALAGAGVLIFLLATSDGRRLFLRPGLYVAGLIALAGLAPAVWYNIRENFAAIEFQAAARHRWAFWPQGLLHTLEQAVIVTPVFFAGLIGAVRIARLRWRESEATAGLILITAAAIFLPYTLMAPFNKAYLYHWPFMAYAPLIAFMPQAMISFVTGGRVWLTRSLRALVVAAGPGLAMLFAFAASGFLLAWAHPTALKPTYQRFLTGDYERWSTLAGPLETTRRVLGHPQAPVVIVGHIPAVRLQFPGSDLTPIFVAPDTDDPLKGFDALRRRWGDDLDALALDYPGELALIAIPDAGYVLDQQPDIDVRLDLCRRFAAPHRVMRVELAPGLRSVDIYSATVRALETPPGSFCGFLPTEYMFKVERGSTLPKEGQNLAGIAVHPSGVSRVEVLLDGAVIGEGRLGLDPTDGRVSRALAFDPRYPKIFWDFYLNNNNLPPGAHRLAIRVTRGDGTTAIGGERVFYAGTGLETLQADILHGRLIRLGASQAGSAGQPGEPAGAAPGAPAIRPPPGQIREPAREPSQERSQELPPGRGAPPTAMQTPDRTPGEALEQSSAGSRAGTAAVVRAAAPPQPRQEQASAPEPGPAPAATPDPGSGQPQPESSAGRDAFPATPPGPAQPVSEEPQTQ